MTIFGRDAVCPEWEPVPWDLNNRDARKQKRCFEVYAKLRISWDELNWQNFPETGVLGYSKKWFVENDISYTATAKDHDLVLIDRPYFGFPDPPRWGCAARLMNSSTDDWMMLGSFPDIPKLWFIPNK